MTEAPACSSVSGPVESLWPAGVGAGCVAEPSLHSTETLLEFPSGDKRALLTLEAA